MKKISVLSAILVLFTAISFTSCDTEPVDPVLNENNNNNGGPALFEVEIDGELFTATAAQATIVNGGIALTGAKSNGEAVGFVTTDVEVGTYENAMQFYIDSEEMQYMNVDPETVEHTGSVIITEIDTENHTISGTFSFSGWANLQGEPKEFTNGVFENIPYTGDIDPTPVGDEYFKAKIDGDLTSFGMINAMELGDQLALVGANAGGSIDIRVPADIATGTYELNDEFENELHATYLSLGEMNGYSAIDGSLTIITHNDNVIKGTFEFVGEDMDGNVIEITDGEFNIELE
jgi:hypothetical protein